METIGNIRLCQEFGWSLEYVAGLTPFLKADLMGFLDGQSKAMNK